MENTTAKQQRLYSFIENIAYISDEKYQERVWVKNEGPECDDIDDTICDFFDDGDPILEKYEDFGITKDQYALLIKLRDKLDKFIDEYGIYSQQLCTEKLIKLPEWKEIREISKKVLEAFNYIQKKSI